MFADFPLPDLGEGIHEAQVISVAVNEGDTVAEDQVLMEVETDKAAVEIPSPQAGVVEKVHVAAGQVIKVGDALVTFGGGSAGAAGKSAPAEKSKTAKQPLASAATAGAADGRSHATASAMTPDRRNGPVPASPAVRRAAREHGIDLRTVRATGPGGRVTRDDLDAHIQSRVAGSPAPLQAASREVLGSQTASPQIAPSSALMAPAPRVEGTPGKDHWGAVVRQGLSQIRKTISAQMTRSYTQVPHVLHAETVDVTELDAFRREYRKSTPADGIRLTLTPFIVRALCNALRAHPKFNCEYDVEKQELVYKQYYNVGMAVDTPRGLVVPVVRHAETKSVLQLAAEFAEIADRVRAGKFAIEELRGGSFTVTNIGALGGTFFTPIINYPEVAILGLGRAGQAPVVRHGEIVIRTTMSLCLSFDHRVCDGAEAARFMNHIASQLESPIRLAL